MSDTQVYATWRSYRQITDRGTESEVMKFSVPSWSNGVGEHSKCADLLRFTTFSTQNSPLAFRSDLMKVEFVPMNYELGARLTL